MGSYCFNNKRKKAVPFASKGSTENNRKAPLVTEGPKIAATHQKLLLSFVFTLIKKGIRETEKRSEMGKEPILS